MKKELLLMIICLVSAMSNAQTATWIGDTGLWTVAANWDINAVPTSAYNVIIPGGSTVNINEPVSARSIQASGDAVLNIGSNLSILEASTLGSNVTTNWSTGSISGGGSLNNNGTLNLISTFNKHLNGATSTINNAGTMNISGSGDLVLSNGKVNNLASGTINFQTAEANLSFSSSTSELFTNAGTIIVSVSGTITVACTFSNSGTISVQTGVFKLNGSDNIFNGGVYNVSSGAILQCEGVITCSGSFTGLLQGAFNWSGNFVVPDAATFNFTGTAPLYWNTGALLGGGTLNNMSELHLTTGSNKSFAGNSTLNNTGTVSIVSDGDLFFSNSTFNNQPTGVFNFVAAGGNLNFSSSTNEMFNNYGTINRSGEPGVATIFSTLTNTGTINVTIGTLALSDGSTQLNGGIYNVSAGATLLLNSVITCSGTLSGLLNGNLNWDGNLNVPTAATFDFSGPSPVKWMSGSLLGGGVLTNLSGIELTTAANKSISANTLNNLDTISIVSNGSLYLSNAIFNNQISGVLNLMAENGNISFSSSTNEMINNYGIINRSGETGLATVFATLTNTGTINITSGTLELSDADTQLNGGIYNVSNNCVFQWSGTINCSGILTGTLEGPIAWNATLKVTAANPATFNFSGSNAVSWRAGTITGGGILTNKSKMLLTSSSQKGLSGSTLDNEGLMTLENTGALYFSNATINNRASGIFKLSSDAIMGFSSSSQHIINNYGLLTKDVLNVSSVIGINVNNYGVIDASLGTIVFNGALNNSITGTIKGIATIDLPSPSDHVNDGTFSPGGAPGKLTVIGNYESTSSSALAVDLNGNTQETQYDLLAIQGNAIFNGTVAVTLGFAAAINDTFTVATTTGTITEFGLNPTTSTIYNGNNYTFDVNVTPDNKSVVLTLVQKVLSTQDPDYIGQNIFLAPNPAQEVISLKNDSGVRLIEAQIYDLNGRHIKSTPITGPTQQLSIVELPSGFYLMQITSEETTIVKRFIVK